MGERGFKMSVYSKSVYMRLFSSLLRPCSTTFAKEAGKRPSPQDGWKSDHRETRLA